VVDDAVDDGGCHVVVTEHGSPSGELEVRGDDQAAFLVTVGDDLEQEPGPLSIDGQISEFIDLCGYPHRSMTSGYSPLPRTPPRASTVSSTPPMRNARSRSARTCTPPRSTN